MISYKTDLSKLPVLMQGFQPCCAEASTTAYVEFLNLLKTGIYTPLSFRYLASKTAALDGVNYASSGTSLAVALSVLKETGICTAATYPNDITLSPEAFIDPSSIPSGADAEAANWKIPDFKILTDTSWDGINAAIQEYKLVISGIYLDKEWYLSNTPNSNPLPLPPPMGMTDPSISKHSILAYGFSDQYRYVRNSFGNTFGQNGDGWIGKEYQPYVFSGAVILDPILQTIEQQVTQLATEVAKIDPQSPTAPKQESLVQKAVDLIEQEIEDI